MVVARIPAIAEFDSSDPEIRKVLKRFVERRRRSQAGDLDKLTDKQIAELDENIREFEGYDGSGRPY